MRRTAYSSALMIDSGQQYHWLTAYTRGRMTGHRLDWSNQPAFFKNYPAATSYKLPLPAPASLPKTSFFEVVKKKLSNTSKLSIKTSDPLTKNLNRSDLATLLLLTSAPTAKSSFENGEIWYRSNASAGALHPLEFYISFPGAADLPAGLYHYDLLKPALQRLRQDPALKNFTTACNCEGRMFESRAAAPILIISALFFRSAWKYRDRAYRYLLLDCGHALENLVLALQFMEVGFEIELNFDDSTINQALHLDQQREIGLVAVRLSPLATETSCKVPVEPCNPEPELSSDELSAVKEIRYTALNEIHQSTSSPLLKKSTRENIKSIFFEGISNWQAIPDNVAQPVVFHSHIEGLSRRRSKRNFIKSKTLLSLTTFYALLDLLLRDTSTFDPIRPEILFSAAGVEGFVDGLYLLDIDNRRCALLNDQDRRIELAAASLDQRWVANAALQFIFFADLELVEKEYGPRSYRYLNIAAGRFGQRLYLGAAALNLGCCAVGAFYDRELIKTCSLPDNFDPLYLVAVGPVMGK